MSERWFRATVLGSVMLLMAFSYGMGQRHTRYSEEQSIEAINRYNCIVNKYIALNASHEALLTAYATVETACFEWVSLFMKDEYDRHFD